MSSKGKKRNADSEDKPVEKKETKKTKTAAPALTKKEFTEKAKNLEIDVAGYKKLTAKPKAFATGSYGWSTSDKLKIEVDGKELQVQVSLNFTVVGSKGNKDDDANEDE